MKKDPKFFPTGESGEWGGASTQEVYAGIALHGILTTKSKASEALLQIPKDCAPGEYLTFISEEQQLALCDRIANAAYLLSEALAAKFEENARVVREEMDKKHKDFIEALKKGE